MRLAIGWNQDYLGSTPKTEILQKWIRCEHVEFLILLVFGTWFCSLSRDWQNIVLRFFSVT